MTATYDYGPAERQRLVGEAPRPGDRHPFTRDRARVLHSSALRRLAAKTQVLTAGESDVPRTRLTHTLEVAQIAREIAMALGAHPDLVELAALAHDLGHPPFGHNGEDALHALAAPCGGFEGNAQTLRILTRLESKVYDGDRSVGLNLTRSSLDACTKYPWGAGPDRRKFGYYDDDAAAFGWARASAPAGQRRCLEAQIMDWADDVAYSVHDVEDAILLGHLDPAILASAAEQEALIGLCRQHFTADADPAELRDVLTGVLGSGLWPQRFEGTHRQTAEVKRMASHLIGRFSIAAQDGTRQHYGAAPLGRYHADLVVDRRTRWEVALLKSVALRYVMQRPGADHIYRQQRELLTELVESLMIRGSRGLEPWLLDQGAAADSDARRLRVVLDQVASLTDVSAVAWHRRLCR